MKHRCDSCKKDFKSEESLKQHNNSKHAGELKYTKSGSKKINVKKYFIFISIILIMVLLILSISSYLKKPGKYDDFAQCLTDKGAIVYGNDYCSYTVKQLGFFGKSQSYLDYVKCAENEALCDSKEVTITPTWEINKESYSGVQTFEKLSALTGCGI